MKDLKASNTGVEAKQGEKLRFSFGRNWARYLKLVDKQRIAMAEESLKKLLERESLMGLRFLDIGSGSGLFSLAARNLGASVYSFDYDPDSVSCTEALRDRYRANDKDWIIEQGDVLDETYLGKLGTFDVVYSWGVLHHTGDMWRALGNVAPLVKAGGQLFVALYNDQRWLSKYWTHVKKLYNQGLIWKLVIIGIHAPYFLFRVWVKRIIMSSSRRRRGMDPWRDILDWLGGYPFEVARPERVLSFYRQYGFILERLTTVDARHGCNQYIFRAPQAVTD